MTAVQRALVAAAKAAKASVLDVAFRTFARGGVSGFVVIAQSHLAVHTWPEHGFAAVDVFTCGSLMDPWRALPPLKRLFRARRTEVLEMPRGLLSGRY